MKVNEAIRIIERNRDANTGKPKFQEACTMAITALKENRPLKQRCMVLSRGTLCVFCRMQCPDLGGEGE